jgi:hypothetical protein
MKTELVQTLTTTFEAHAQQTEGGIEYWLARDLQHLLGYDEWRNFNAAISKAMTACEVSGHRVADHFVGVNKMVDLGSGTRPVGHPLPSDGRGRFAWARRRAMLSWCPDSGRGWSD